MNTRQKHWLFFSITAIGAIVVVNLAILLMWTDMTEEERVFGSQIFGRVVTYGTLAMIVLFFISSQFIRYIFRNYISPIETLTEETRLIANANAKYRIKPVGALETHNLTSVINELADEYISLKSDVKNIVTESKEGFDDEKRRLKTLMNMTPEGVIICNHDGRILTCNHQAYKILNSVDHNEVGRFSKLGLGRSIFSIFNRMPVIFSLDLLQKKVSEKQDQAIHSFITTRYKIQYLSVKISPVLKGVESISGYIFSFNDITAKVQNDDLEDFNAQSIILDEMVSIANLKTKNHYNFITEEGVWIDFQYKNVIDYMIETCSYIKHSETNNITIGMSSNNQLKIGWETNEINTMTPNYSFNELILKQDNEGSKQYIELDVPLKKQIVEVAIKEGKESRPIYDYQNHFDQSIQSNEMDNMLLKDLTFVVFDTETTGLSPSDGDEIISIAGVRLYNGKINNEEIFDELVNPQRSIPLYSLKIHEIYPKMLENKLTIDKVLPLFHEFTDNAILVAHNAAFDMRFLQLKEKQAGVQFTNPVLDTMLLSAVCHPKQELHNLEDIAEKCGVEIIGRHTALGDAMVTAEVFLKQIPILESLGIKTLGQAREASTKTPLSKIKF